MINPFDISFGKRPHESISRFMISKDITDSFLSEPITRQIYMITGVRGSGKTVLMNSIANTLEQEKDWIIIRLNPDRDLLNAFASKLCSDHTCAEIFRNAKLNLSFLGLGIEISGSPRVTDIEAAIEKMLKSLKKHHKRVLVTIDEVSSNPHMKAFCSAFQIFIGQELPLFLLMTGLYENIDRLQNEKTLTFLYRAPKVQMLPLNIRLIADRYQKIFSVSNEESLRLAALTNGFPFAFQALGYSLWEHRNDSDEFMNQYQLILEEYVYEKIWSELSEKDRMIASGIAHISDGSISRINNYLGLKPNEINQYRKRLIRRGIVESSSYGHLKFTLPLFDRFVINQEAMRPL